MMRYIVWSVLLFLDYASGSSTYPELCFPVYFSVEHSAWDPDIHIPHQENFTMFQEFCIENSTTAGNVTTNFTSNASWSHPRNNLSDPNRYYINNPLSPYRKGNQQCVKPSITLLNVTKDDHGLYTVAVFTTCGSCNHTNFTLEISSCDEEDPRPVNPTQKPVFISDLNRPPSLSFQFQGDSKNSDYIFYLMKFGKTLKCTDNTEICMSAMSNCENVHIICHRDILQCNTTLSVQFHNFTNQDVGKYCAAPSLLGSGSVGNMSCVELDIQRSDQVLIVPLAVPLGVGVLIIIVISIAIVVVCKRSGQRKAAQPRHRDEEPLLASGTTTVGADYQGLSQSYSLSRTHSAGASPGKVTAGIDIESDLIRDSCHIQNGTTPRDCEALWQKLPNIVLNTSQLQKISQQLNKWEPLARALGLEEPDITEIQENNPRNYKEQRYQMLHKWYQGEKQASLKSLIRCVEVELGDKELAQKIVTALK